MIKLTKEEFWDKIEQAYPDAFALFANWIDKYKQEVGWDLLFFNGPYETLGRQCNRDIKFHDLPFEMQNGILARFDIECFNGVITGRGKKVYESNIGAYTQGFEKLFKDLNDKLITTKF